MTWLQRSFKSDVLLFFVFFGTLRANVFMNWWWRGQCGPTTGHSTTATCTSQNIAADWRHVWRIFGLQMLTTRRFPVAWLQRSFKSDVCKGFCYFLQLCVQVRLSIGDGAPHVALLWAILRKRHAQAGKSQPFLAQFSACNVPHAKFSCGVALGIF